MEQHRAKKRIGISLRRYILGTSPCWKYVRMFGCDSKFLNDFISWQMHNGMTWENFGVEWQIDHILPLCLFDMTSEEDCRICWNWANLRPLKNHINKARNSYLDALLILKRRREAFPSNEMLEKLENRTEEALSQESGPEVDWSLFSKSHPHHVIFEETKSWYDSSQDNKNDTKV